MKLFSRLFHDLDELTKTNDRIDRLARYFEESDPVDSIWACWFLAGNRIKRAIKTSELRSFASARTGFPVSYTHLRAHETGAYLVCRLLLEKKNK